MGGGKLPAGEAVMLHDLLHSVEKKVEQRDVLKWHDYQLMRASTLACLDL